MSIYKCNRCEKEFKLKGDWKRHKARKFPCQKKSRKKFPKNARKFPCPHCGKRYISQYNLDRHLSTSCKGSLIKPEIEQKMRKKSSEVKYGSEDSKLSYDYIDVGGAEKHGIPDSGDKLGKLPPKLGQLMSKNASLISANNGHMCTFCGQKLSAKRHLQRHLKTCKKKREYEVKILINQKDKQLIALKQEKEEIEKQFLEFMKEMARKSTNKVVYNDNRNVNMFYIINNYDDAENYEALMSPKLSTGEISYLRNKGPTTGGYQLIMDRCVTGKDMNKRPFHCVDESRNKYLLRTNNDWKVDNGGQRIIEDAIEKIRGAYNTEIKYNDTREVRDRKLAIISDLMDLEIKGKKRILRELNKHTLLKNNVEE